MSQQTNPLLQACRRSTGGFVSVSTKISGSTSQLHHAILPASQLRRPTEKSDSGLEVPSITASAEPELSSPPAPAAQAELRVKAVVL